MFKRILVAAIAAAATFMPVGAEVQEGTTELLTTLENSGILVTYNHPDCETNNTHGSYRWIGFQREMRLCPGDTVDAKDHNTVRHETIHAIQHCVNVARGTDENTPVIQDEDTLREFVLRNLTQEQIEFIFAAYPQDQWLVELEAFAGAEHYTASELQELFLSACVMSTDT